MLTQKCFNAIIDCHCRSCHFSKEFSIPLLSVHSLLSINLETAPVASKVWMILPTASSTDETMAFRTTCSRWATVEEEDYLQKKWFWPEHQIGFCLNGLQCHRMTSTYLGPWKYKQWLWGASIFLPGTAPWVQRRKPVEKSQKTRVSKPHLKEPGLRRVGKELDGVDGLLGPQLGAVLALPLPAHLETWG